jgi:hypothetical protein
MASEYRCCWRGLGWEKLAAKDVAAGRLVQLIAKYLAVVSVLHIIGKGLGGLVGLLFLAW